MNQLIKKLPFSKKNATYDQAVACYQQGNFKKAIEIFQEMATDPKKGGIYYNLSLFYMKESYLHLGFAYEHLGMYENAIKNFTAALQICNHADIHYQIGLCYCFLEDFERAKQEFGRALEINPNYAASIFLMGFSLVRLRQFHEAVLYFQKAIAFHPHYADYHYLLGSLYGLHRQFDSAQGEFRKSLEINPRYQEAAAKLTLIEESLKGKEDGLNKADVDQKLISEFLKDFAAIPIPMIKTFKGAKQAPEGEDIILQAILFYEKAVQINPKYADLHHTLGMYYAKRGDHARAEASFLQALRINPTYIQALINLALTYQKTGQTDQSILIFLKAVALRPQYPDLHYYLGTLYAEKNDLPAALAEFEKALSLNPHYPECHIALAILYGKQNQPEKAALYWNLYLKDHPDPEFEREIQSCLGQNLSPKEKSSSPDED
ncbi:MAG: tetratricopeptide repeat protein [bacterium]